MASYTSNAPLPQGFSVYQPQLGAQLQFFPALGSQELDDMMNAYIPGSAPLKEKRTTITLDFLEHSQLTGQTFKFYPVYSSSPVAASPVNSIATSSLSNTSPVNSTWDWSQASASPSASSRSSVSKSRRASKSSNLVARYSAIDLSSLPGMKIMTKNGEDVTDSASRGSKTKEQRDHAHLMRIIKACDSCRRKKIRCDPDHKKRSTSQAQPQSSTKSSKKARASPPVAATPAPQKPVAASVAISTLDDNPGIPMSILGLDPTFTFAGLDSFESTDQMTESWEEFIQYPPAELEDDYDFFLDPQGYFSSSQSSASSSSASPPKALTPASQQELLAISGFEQPEGMLSQSTSPQLPFLQDSHTAAANNYTDFNLFSPSSSFSEDDRMVPISSTRTLSPSQLSASGDEMVFFNASDTDGHTLATDWSGTSASVSPLEAGVVAGPDRSMPWYDPGHSSGASREEDSRAGISVIPPGGWVGGVRIAHQTGGSVLVTMDSGSGMEVIANSAPPGRSDVSGSGIVSIEILGRDTSVDLTTSSSESHALQLHGDIQDESLSYNPSPTERGRIARETSVGYSSWLSSGEADDFRSELASEPSISPSTLASATNRTVQFSTGSEESPMRAQTELAVNGSVNPEVSPGGLQASVGMANVLPASSVHMAASVDTMGVSQSAVPDTRNARRLELLEKRRKLQHLRYLRSLRAQQSNASDMVLEPLMASRANSGTEALSSVLLQGISPQADIRAADEAGNLAADLEAPSPVLLQVISAKSDICAADEPANLATDLEAPSPVLLQVISAKSDIRAADEPADKAADLEPRWFQLRQVLTTQAVATVLVATLVGATFTSMVGLYAVLSFVSLVLNARSILQHLGTLPGGVEMSRKTTPSTMSSSRSREDVCRRGGIPYLRHDQYSVSGHGVSGISSRFSSFIGGSNAAFVAPLMG